MAYKTFTDLSADTTVSLGGINRKTGKKNPIEVEGYYLGKRSVEDKKKKSGTSNIYFFQTANGNIGVWGKTNMDQKMAQAQVGLMTLVQFDKMVNTPNGEMYKYIVAQDPDLFIEVSDYSADTSTGSDYIDEEETVETEEEETDTEDALQSAALAAAERRKKVDALLNRKGK